MKTIVIKILIDCEASHFETKFVLIWTIMNDDKAPDTWSLLGRRHRQVQKSLFRRASENQSNWAYWGGLI